MGRPELSVQTAASAEGFTVRRCREQDVPAVLELWERERSGHASVGALIAAWDGWRGNMYRLAVRGDRRREGIGLALVRAGEDYLRGRGARRITALVAFEDEAAASFWEAAGYPRDLQIGRRVRNV